MKKQALATKDMVQTLSGFGPSYADLMSDPDASRGIYDSHIYVDVVFASKRYLLRFNADYDIPGAVYLSGITVPATGERWFASECARESYMDVYPLDWAWV